MKRKVMLCGVVLILGLLALGCGNPAGGGGDGGLKLSETTWTGYVGGAHSVTFTTDTDWERTNSNGSQDEGTYTYSGNTITLETTNSRSNSGAQWADATGEEIVIVGGMKMVTENGDILTNEDAEVGEGPFNGSAYKSGTTVLIFSSNSAWLLIDTGGFGRRGTYTYSDYTTNFENITLNQTGVTHDFGANWSAGGAPYYGTASDQSLYTITIDDMNGEDMTFTRQ